MFELLHEIRQTVSRNRLRTSLTGFAVAWGIFMLIVLLGAGNGIINAQLANNADYIDNSMAVFGGQTSKAHEGLKEGRAVKLNETDLSLTGSRFANNVDRAGAVIYTSVTIALDENYVSSTLRGVFPVDAEINRRRLAAGRFINDIDMREQRKVIIISENQARELLPGRPLDLVGRIVKVGVMAFNVVGIIEEDKSTRSNNAIAPFTTLRTIYNRGEDLDRIEFIFHGLETEADNKTFETQYRATVNQHHRAAPDDEEAIWLWNRFTQALQMQTGVNIIRTALWVIGLFTLLSGIVGVSNIMLISVRERTHEFGIRKAIGARPLSILRIIIVESVIVTGFFGYVGMVLGILANHYMEITVGSKPIDTGLFKATMFVDPNVGLGTAFGVTFVLIVAGTLAGLIPALKAARVRPVEALNAG